MDRYFCQLYDQYITRTIRRGDSVEFEYEYVLLLRWLLKLLYNNARGGKADDTDILRLSRYADFILHGGSLPSEILLFLQLIIPHEANGKEIAPSYMACGAFPIPDFDPRTADMYVVGIDAFRFIISILRDVSPAIRRRVQQSIEHLPATSGSVRLYQAERKKTVKASDIDALYAVGPVIGNDLRKWEQRLKKS